MIKKIRKNLEKHLIQNRDKFLKDLAKKEDYLKDNGFTDEDINRMKLGFNPEGWQVHHKLPIDDSGTK